MIPKLPGSTDVTPPVGSPPEARDIPKTELEHSVNETAKDKLTPPPAPPEKKGWGFWGWFGLSKKEPVKSEVAEKENEGSSTDTELSDDDETPVETKGAESGTNESTLGAVETPAKGGEKKLEKEINKANEVGKSWWRAYGGDAVIGKGMNLLTWGATAGIQAYAAHYSSGIDKNKRVAESKQAMVAALNDPLYLSLFEMIRGVVVEQANSKMNGFTTGFAAANILPQRGLIIDLLEINLAKGFANLAKQAEANRATIPNYDKQPALVNILSLLSQKAGAHISLQKLASIEEKYRKARTEFPEITKKMFPNIDNEPQKQALIQKYLAAEPLDRAQIVAQLFPDFDDAPLAREKEIREFIFALNVLSQRHHELKQLFALITDDILLNLFPNKFSDMEVPGVLQYGFIQDFIYNNFVKDLLANFLQESYEPMESDPTKIQGWENDLQTRIGAPELKPIIEAPASFLVAFTKNFIQADSRAVGLTSWALNGAVGNPTASDKEKILSELSNAPLANWIVESTQSMLHSQDPQLVGLGQFIKQGLNSLTLALLAQGAKLVIPEGESIEENQFAKELTDRIVAKVKSLKGDETIPDDFWKEFVKDLPLPPLVKNLLVPLLIEKGKSLQAEMKKKAPELQDIQKLYNDSEAKIKGYKGGAELLSITEKISDQIIEQVLEKNVGLVSTFGLGDSLEDLAAQYLPGVKINEGLKEWFKENISALGVTENGKSPESIVLLKQGIQAVLKIALVTTIEANFKDNSQEYAAQLLQNIRGAFAKAISGFDKQQREELDKALVIQSEIKAKKAQVEELQKEMAKKPEKLTPEQETMIEETLNANRRVVRAEGYVASLKAKRDELLEKFNSTDNKYSWEASHLPYVEEALALHKVMSSSYSNKDDYQAELLKQNTAAIGNQTDTAQRGMVVRDILSDILEMSPEELKLVSEAIHIEATLKHAEKELDHLKAELQDKKQAIDTHHLGNVANRADWDIGKTWLEENLGHREEMSKLSQEIEALQQELDTHLKTFQTLAQELAGLIGLDQKDKLKLPPFLETTVWPLVESAKKQHIARLLFEQLTPMLLTITDIQKNKDRLSELSKGDEFLAQLAQGVSQEVVSRIPDFVTSYKPFMSDILMVMGIENPTPEEIERMEKAFLYELVELGKEKAAASMLRPMVKGLFDTQEKVAAGSKEEAQIKAKEEALSIALEKLIEDSGDGEITLDEVSTLLKKEIAPKDKKEEREVERKAQRLTTNLNQFLTSLGKADLTPQVVLKIYQTQRKDPQPALEPDQEEGVIHDLTSENIVSKLKTVVITPEEIASTLNDAIPGAHDLHALVAPQLQAVITDDRFKDSRELIQGYIEGLLLKVFVKIAEANAEDGQDIMAVLTRKLQEIVPNADAIKGKKPEEVAHQMVDEVLENILGVASQEDLDGVPTVLREMAYKIVKEQAYQQITPLLLPMIQRAQSLERLQELSGSKFLSTLCEALSKDVFYLLPYAVNSYRSIAQELFGLLSGRDPTPEEVEQFTKEIVGLVKENKDVTISHSALLEAYVKVAKITLSDTEKKELLAKLDTRGAKNAIGNVIISPEEIVAHIGEAMPDVDPKLLQAFASELQQFMHASPTAYQNVSTFASHYVEGVLLKIFIRIAEKNPPQKGKDSLIVLTEKLLERSVKKYQEAKKRPIEEVVQELIDEVMKDLLGIDSPEVFAGLPDPAKAAVYKAIRDQLGGMLLKIQKGLATLDSTEAKVGEAKGQLTKFGVAVGATKGYAEIVAEDIANMVIQSVPGVLSELGGEKLRGVNIISKAIESNLMEFSRGNIQMAAALLNYTRGTQFQEMLGGIITNLSDDTQHVEDKVKATDLLGNLILVPLNQVLDKVVTFEKEKGAEFNQKLMANIFVVAAGHLKNLNEAKRIAASHGRKEILHADFVEAAGARLHPGVPVKPVNYQGAIDAIRDRIYKNLSPTQQPLWLAEQDNLRAAIGQLVSEEVKGVRVLTQKAIIAEVEKVNQKVAGAPLKPWQVKALKAADDKGLTLREVIRKEAEAGNIQRQSAAYGPTIEAILKMLFPNGKKDLTFVPEELRGQAWKILKVNLMPVILPMIVEQLLEPDIINKIVLSSLEATKESLQGKIVLGPEEPADRPIDALDIAAGALVGEVLKSVTLPEWVKNLLRDNKGELSPAMQRTIGASLRTQFNGTFIKEKLETALKSAVQRDTAGNYALKFDKASKEEKDLKAKEARIKMQSDLKKASRDVVDVSISYAIRSQWVKAQARFDALIEKSFGKIGTDLKKALDEIFGFIFFKIVGTFFSILFSPLEGLIKNGIYNFISLDENRDILLGLFTKQPTDQPVVGGGHTVYNEDLVFNLQEVIIKTITEALETPPSI